MLSLTNHQLDIVRRAAIAIPADWRSRFFEAIADRLLGCVATDDDVSPSLRALRCLVSGESRPTGENRRRK